MDANGFASMGAAGAKVDLRIINPANLACIPVPPREWIVDGWLPIGCVTANYGDGGVGKTLLAQQLMTSTALGGNWCGMKVMRCNSLGLFCEDDEDELHRRQAAICAAYGVSMSELDAMRWVSGVGQDNALMNFDLSRSFTTPMYDAILRGAKDHDARLVVLDTAADLFPGNENDRHQVRRFIGQLTALAIEIRGAVLLNAHPSRAGLSTGNLDGGSTAWNNSVRSRWSLARPGSEDGAEPDTNARTLTRRKANYASTGDAITLEFREGLFTVPQRFTAGTGDRKDQAEAAFLAALEAKRAAGTHVSANARAGNYAPKILNNTPEGRDFSPRELIDAMGNLMKRGCLQTQPYQRNHQTHEELVRADK